MVERTIAGAGVALAATEDGEGIPVVLLHGLTASRRYVVMGSRALQRSGHRVIAYDARGHGSSSPAPAHDAYGYGDLGADLVAVLDAFGCDRAVLAGASMGAHTIVRVALDVPERLAGIVLITPAYDPVENEAGARLRKYDVLARELRRDGIDGFVEARELGKLPASWRASVETFVRQSMARHEHPEAVADALEVVPRSRPFEDLHALELVECPAVVVADRDEVDPGHPLALAEAYAELLPKGRLVVEAKGKPPLAWQGGQLSKVIAQLAAEAW